MEDGVDDIVDILFGKLTDFTEEERDVFRTQAVKQAHQDEGLRECLLKSYATCEDEDEDDDEDEDQDEEEARPQRAAVEEEASGLDSEVIEEEASGLDSEPGDTDFLYLEEENTDPSTSNDGDGESKQKDIYPLPSRLSDVKLPVMVLAHHHHIVQFVDVDPAFCPPRWYANSLSNSSSDYSNHYHTSRHQHRLRTCKIHVPSADRQSVYWNPYVRMRSSTIGTFSSFRLHKGLCYIEMSHDFIHLHEVFCKDICLNPQGEPHMCPQHPMGSHQCPLLHFKVGILFRFTSY
ncbi:hypothetical protein KP509_01G041900 [Ceratopteris richardii]|uniref:Uncharacterized protein n=1 Tax=Ceratopteris richardii TaxID=49495 RepID=A0A8T2VGB8_CERRI|nr:hypothetical protein KP509_01G041900 [Ceratopteris richardii]